MFSPIRIRKLVSPVTVQSGARSVAWKIAELTSSLNQSISQNASPARMMSQRRRSTSTA